MAAIFGFTQSRDQASCEVAYRLMLRGYHGILIPGHPNIGIESLWHMVSPLMVSRLFLLTSTLIMNALFWDKLKGSHGHWLLGVYGVVLAVLMDCWIIAGAVAAGKPREGMMYACFSVSVIAALVTCISGFNIYTYIYTMYYMHS